MPHPESSTPYPCFDGLSPDVLRHAAEFHYETPLPHVTTTCPWGVILTDLTGVWFEAPYPSIVCEVLEEFLPSLSDRACINRYHTVCQFMRDWDHGQIIDLPRALGLSSEEHA